MKLEPDQFIIKDGTLHVGDEETLGGFVMQLWVGVFFAFMSVFFFWASGYMPMSATLSGMMLCFLLYHAIVFTRMFFQVKNPIAEGLTNAEELDPTGKFSEYYDDK